VGNIEKEMAIGKGLSRNCEGRGWGGFIEGVERNRRYIEERERERERGAVNEGFD
jgi:hypothetical protein